MQEKIFDIFPPKPEPTNEVAPTKAVTEKVVRAKSQKRVSSGLPQRNFGVLFFFFIFLVLAVGAYFYLPEARIQIWPKVDTLSFNEKVTVNSNIDNSDFSGNVILGRVFQDEVEVAGDFPASGKLAKTQKAKGQIRVFNAYSDAQQVLILGTRFISAEGKLFKTTVAVTVPGGTYDEKRKLTPGFVDVDVVAAEAGEDYNIGPSTFSIPGFVGTPKYTAFYGKSLSSMVGGSTKEGFEVTQDDLIKAKTQLAAQFLDKGRQSLQSKISEDFVLLDQALSQEEEDAVSSAGAGQEANSFHLKITGTIKALAFKKSDIEAFAGDRVLSQLGGEAANVGENSEGFLSGKKIKTNSLVIHNTFTSIDWQNGSMVLAVDGSAQVYRDMKDDVLRTAVVGKSKKEVESVLADQSDIVKSRIDFWPFWVTRVPYNLDRIRVDLQAD